MKKITLILVFIGMIALQGCTIEENPDYVDNDTISEVFEVTRSFSPQNEFSSLITLNPQIYASDVVLVYLLWDVQNGTPIWRLMPQTVQLDEGDLQYNYDFTQFDVNLFLSSADFPLTILGPQWTQNQTFRIVIVPGYFSGKIDYSDYNKVMKSLGYSESDVKKID
ncbi:MAG TPA: hypothetical protein PLC36_08170 [Flavobacterium sp.]|jgi:hypothetical protein|nr:hypothetical protein [Flavobacterium sp.]HQX04818.1 hypothetical protein [Flavobacterium sp.]HRZ31546.1 hypothetical protein [Flavobacterium sp.]